MQKTCNFLLKIVAILLTTGIRNNVSFNPDAVGNRLLDPSVAGIKGCIICVTKWSLIEEDWKIIKPPNEESLREVAGISINGNS